MREMKTAIFGHWGMTAALAACALGAPAEAQILVGDGSVQCGGAYTIVSGDTLSRVAERAYGDPLLYGFILDANWNTLGGNAERVEIGMSLAVPCIDASGRLLTPEEAEAAANSIDAAVRAEGPLSPEQIDTLFGPIALFPDPVLSPLLVAVTFPLDVVKAARFVEEAEAMPDKERADAAAAQPWDPSVQDLAAAFPDLLTRMNDHLDWTEQAGEAVLAQTDDVLDAIQRLRAKAQENGYLVDNPAQEIVQEGNAIYITPADPQVVYVPTYDSQVIYATPTAAPPVYYYDDYADGWEDALVAGGIMLGGAIILDEIFDDDDDWDGWGDWDDDVDVDWDGGDITIDRDEINIDRDDLGIDRGDVGDRLEAGDGRLGDGEGAGLIDGSERGERRSIGELERPEIAAGAGIVGGAAAVAGRRAVSSPASRDAARQKIAARESSGAGIATLPARQPSGSRASDGSRPAGASNSLASRPTATARPSATSRQSAASRPTTSRQPTARASSRSNAFERSSGGNQARAASSRGRSSAGGRSGGGRSGGRR